MDEQRAENQFNNSVAHIVYASDDQFAEILGVSMVSLFENSKDMDSIQVYILDSGISDLNLKRIKRVCETYCQPEPVVLKAKDITKELKMNVAVDRGSLSQYARLFIQRDLPENLNRVLYLDCDTIIQKSIKELWNLDMHGKTIAALKDAFSNWYRMNIDLKPNDIMFNSGVMLIDLNKWRIKKIEERLLKFISKKHGHIQQGDQGALNHVLSHDIYCFEPRFNSVTIFYDFSYKEMLKYRQPVKYYAEKEIKKSISDPSIVHFTTSFLSKRPWMKDCHHMYYDEWRKYKDMSPWKDEPQRDDLRSQWRIQIFSTLPRSLAISVASWFQVYARPIKNRIKLGLQK
jgi:lipopolysaccharide biosynthesis glycosyltransferase